MAVSALTTKTFVLAAGAIITLALYILARLARGNLIFPSTMLLWAMWLPVVAYALSAAFSGVAFSNSFWGTALEPDTLGFMLVAAVLGTLSTLVLRRSDNYSWFFKAAAYAFAVVAAIQVLIVIIGQFAPNTISPAYSLVGSYSDLATLMGLGVVGILITLRFLDVSRKTAKLLTGAGVLAIFILAVANASLVWIMLALVSLGLFVEAVMKRGKSADADVDDATVLSESPVESDEGNHSLVMPLVVLAVSLFFLIGGTLGGALANALHVNILNIRPSWQSTFTVAEKTITQAPLFGSGPGTFGVQWLKYRDAGLNSTIFWNVDFSSGIGFIPSSFATTGVVGAILWIAFLVLFIGLGLRMLITRTPQDPQVRYVAILSFIGTVYLFATAFFDLPGTVLLALAFVFAGIFTSTMRYATEGQQWGIIFSRSPRIGFVIVFSLTILLLSSVVGAYSLVGRYVADAQLASAAVSLSNGNLDAADQAVQNSVSFAPSSIAYQLQSGIANARLASIVSSSTIDKATAQKAYQAALSSGINSALTATNLNPNDYQGWLALGNLYAQAVPIGVTGAYDSARTAFKKAQDLNPTNPQIPYILAQLDIANKDTKTAQTDLKAAIALKQDYTAAIFLLSQLEVQDGNVKEALNSALAAAYFTPNDPNILFQVGVLYAASADYQNAAAALSAAVQANAQFANARYFLAAVLAKLGDLKDAQTQVQAIADMSADNAKAVASQLDALKAGRNPFPANLLSASSTPVQ